MNFDVANFKEFRENRNQSKDGFVFKHSVSMEVSSFVFYNCFEFFYNLLVISI